MRTTIKLRLDDNLHEFVITNGPTVRQLTKLGPFKGDKNLLHTTAAAIPAHTFASACADKIRDYIRDYLLLDVEDTRELEEI